MERSPQSVYILFAVEDARLARTLAEQLAEAGFITALDEELAFKERKSAGLSRKAREADFLVALVSDAFLRSARLSATLGIAIGYAGDDGRPTILPVALNEEIALPDSIRSLVYIRPGNPRARPEEISIYIVQAINESVGRRAALDADKVEFRDRVERQLEKDIDPVLGELKMRESRLSRAAISFYALALISLAVGLKLPRFFEDMSRTRRPSVIGSTWLNTALPA